MIRQVREFAEQVVFSNRLEDKLAPAGGLIDESPGPAMSGAIVPGRPDQLTFSRHKNDRRVPNHSEIIGDAHRSELLHYFANHELLAVELMALTLLKFPNAPKAFRQDILKTLREEQRHVRFYLARLKALNVRLGDFPVSGFFWNTVGAMQSPADYVARLSLTFEQANLDFSLHYAEIFRRSGDPLSAKLLQRIHDDEISHVGCGLKWFNRWRDGRETLWESHTKKLSGAFSVGRAKGLGFDFEGRLKAGLDEDYVSRLRVFNRSKGRTPHVYWGNLLAEREVMTRANRYNTPKRVETETALDLETIILFLAKKDDIALLRHKPRLDFLLSLQHAGFQLPDVRSLPAQHSATMAPDTTPTSCVPETIQDWRPWAHTAMAQQLFAEANLKLAKEDPLLSGRIASYRQLASKARQADYFNSLTQEERSVLFGCEDEFPAGRVVASYEEVLSAVSAYRREGNETVVVKSPYGCAGRGMLRLMDVAPERNQGNWIQRILKEYGAVVVQPWRNRLADFSFQFERRADGKLKSLGGLTLLCDRRGQFKGCRAYPNYHSGFPKELYRLAPETRSLNQGKECLMQSVNVFLGAKSYVGPLGVDGFIYLDNQDKRRIHWHCEMNPRFTFGRVLIEIMKQVGPNLTGELTLEKADPNHSNYPLPRELLSKNGYQPEPVQGSIQKGVYHLTDPRTATSVVAKLRIYP